MRYLIDGYNLLHALGMAPTPVGPTLEKARLRLLEWLAAELGPAAAADDLCVVFDSRSDRGGSEQTFRGLRVRFSRGETADDLIERLVHAETVPAALAVVSSDHRLCAAARRRGCAAFTCGEYIDRVSAKPREQPKSPPPEEKPAAVSDAEIEELLKEFGGEG
jgi:predicted RNA-binding protein with PIN domain